jgi:transcriptional regulator with XRE-family HTH domain
MGNDSFREVIKMPRRVKTRTPFAQRLVNIRSAKGLTQMELARMTRLSPRVIALYETHILQPNMAVVVRLAKVLQVSSDDLLGHRAAVNQKTVSPKVIKRAKLIDHLSPTHKKAILDLIDSYHHKRASRKNGVG